MKIQNIERSKIKPHPKNPRIVIREDVVDSLVAGMQDGFHPSYALKVHPDGNGGFYILAGHHRHIAAGKADIGMLPCWVRDDLNDDEAYMLLATDNSQGELSPLEIGMHALNYVPKAVGGRGQRGGLSEYAMKIGKSETPVRMYRQAAEVATNSATSSEVSDLLDKAKHLSAIHALPESCWPEAVSLMLKKEWSAKETQEKVKAAKTGKTEKQVAALFLGQTSTKEMNRIADLKATLERTLKYQDLINHWSDWFRENDPIDIKEVQAKRVEIEDIQYERVEAERAALEQEERIQQELERQKLPGLVLADPPWKYDFSNTDSRQIENQYPSATVEEIIQHEPETQDDCVLFLWATAPKLKEAIEVLEAWGFRYKTHSVWDKEKIGMGYWFRGQHELLLVGTKGNAKPPEQDHRVSSVFREARGSHSKKPACVYEWIEAAFPSIKKLEMYCRDARDGWLTWGNES